jgi:hypothetical protein
MIDKKYFGSKAGFTLGELAGTVPERKNRFMVPALAILAGVGILGSAAIFAWNKYNIISESRINVDGKEYRILDTKREGVTLSEFPYTSSNERIVDADRDGNPDFFKYTTFQPGNRMALPISIPPTSSQSNLFMKATKDFYNQRATH